MTEIRSKDRNGILFTKFLHKDANIAKLKTHEDPYHLHKGLGTLSLLSFIYRYGYVYNTTGTLGFEGTAFDWATMIVHTLLAFSSQLFRVPKHRLENKPMVIYEEYRQHAMVFTTRCFSVFVLATSWPQIAALSNGYLPETAPVAVIPLVVAAHHRLADRITAIHGNGSTAVRANVDKKVEDGKMGLKISEMYKKVGLLYSYYQFLAVASHILPNERLADLAYNAIIAIASSAFMMTLYRKRIIRGSTHMVMYSLCLVLSAFHIVRLIGLGTSALALCAFLVRVNLPRQYSNKYVIWTIFLASMQWEHMHVLKNTTIALVDNIRERGALGALSS